jgi:LysM repeat protein
LTQTAYTRQQPTARRRGSGLAWLVLFFWLALVAAAAAGYFGLRQLHQGDRILPGVQALGVDLGGKSPSQAARALQNAWGERRVTLQAGENRWTLSPEQLGLRLDADATARVAGREGRNTADLNGTASAAMQVAAYALQDLPALRDALATLDPRLAAVQEITIAPAIGFDRRQAAETIRTLAQQLEVPPQDASVSVVDGQVTATPSANGQALDLTAGIAALEARAGELATADTLQIELPVVSIPPTLADVSAVVQEVAPLLQNRIDVTLWDPIKDERLAWSAGPQEMGQWLAFERSAADPGKIEWRVDETKVGAYLAEQEKALGPERYVDRQQAIPLLVDAFKSGGSSARLRMHYFDRRHTVQSGETISSIGEAYGVPYPWILKANPDLGEMLMVGQEIVIPSPDALLPLPPVENKRIEVSIGEQRMRAYEDGQLKWDWVASTGLPSSPTSPGVFQIQNHEEMAYANQWDLHMPFFMGIYRPAPDGEVMNGFHGFPSRDKKQLLWTKNLGRPVTYGCVLLDTKNAEELFRWADEGVIVEVKG